MINIANKPWDNLNAKDIKAFLSEQESVTENFFFEFKDDRASNDKFIKEVAAFSNTYGGYVFLGIADDKTVNGCTTWTEERILNVIYNDITPVPIFDVKSFYIDDKKIYVVRIEEGNMPPYITNKGKIYTRVSSGSMPVTNSSILLQIYSKREDKLKNLGRKIELEAIAEHSLLIPPNLCAYLDVGFSLTCSEKTQFQRNFYTWDFSKTCELLKNLNSPFSISQIGDAYLISFGSVLGGENDKGKLLPSGIQNFIEIMNDGSVRFRTILLSEEECCNIGKVNLFTSTSLAIIYQQIYETIISEPFNKIFLYAQKYENLHVIRQFVPYYKTEGFLTNQDDIEKYQNYNKIHKTQYGNNIMIISNRIPKHDYILLDKRWFQENNIPYNTKTIVETLFYTHFLHLGYMDSALINNVEN